MTRKKKKIYHKLQNKETTKIGHARIRGLNLEADPVLDLKADQGLEQKADQDHDLAQTDRSQDHGPEADPDQFQGQGLQARRLKGLDRRLDQDQIVPATEVRVDQDLVPGKQSL